MRPHVPEEEFHAYADGELSSAQRAEIAEHLLACLICRSVFGEVQEVRARASRLLSIATPRTIKRPAVPVRTQRRITGWAGAVAAATVAVVGLNVWQARTPSANQAPSTRLASAFVAPTIFARGATALSEPDGAAPLTTNERTLTIASRAVIRPHVVGPSPVLATVRRFRPVEPLAEVDPSAGWESISWENAVELAHGSIARLDGYSVSAVRIRRSADGARPTFLVRHQLPDGRSLWVVEGPVDNVGPVHQLLEASGLSMSIPLRAKPDYIGTDDAPARTVRVVTIAGYLPSDSLDVMRGKLTLQ